MRRREWALRLGCSWDESRTGSSALECPAGSGGCGRSPRRQRQPSGASWWWRRRRQTAEDGTSEKLTPCFVCATVGTTSSNALGPLPEIADLSRARPRQHVALAQDFARWRATPRRRRQGGSIDWRIRSNLFPTKYLHRIRTRLGWLPEPDLGLDDRVERHYCVGHN